MSEPVVIVEVDDRVAVVTLNRPDARNALNQAIRRALPRAVLDLEARDDVDVLILTGADPAFCAGVDLKEFGTTGSSPASERSGPRTANPAAQQQESKREDIGERRDTDMGARDSDGRLPFRGPLPARTKPLIGAINGVAITGGLELALACDLLVASERARFADTHTRVGVQPGWGLIPMLCQSIGVRRAREMSATGNFVDAATALTDYFVYAPKGEYQFASLADVATGSFQLYLQSFGQSTVPIHSPTYAVFAQDDAGR